MAKSKKNRNTIPIFLLIILPLLAIGISSFAIFKGVHNYITTSDYFRIRELKMEGITDARYLSLMKDEILGTNIFRVNARKLSERIKRRFPNLYSVTVRRFLPSQLLIIAKERLPVAVVKRDVYYIFDAEGVVLSSMTQSVLTSLPLIVGLENRLQKIRVGTAYSLGQLHKALALAKTLKTHATQIQTSLPKDERRSITKIDAGQPPNLIFYLGDDIQVKIGDGDFEDRLDLLPAILRSIGADVSNVKYIDLRPKEPVVAMKNKK